MGNTSGPFYLHLHSSAVLRGHRSGERRKPSETSETKKKITGKCARSEWSLNPAVSTLRGTTALQWQRCSESCQHPQGGEQQRSWLAARTTAAELWVRVLGLCPPVPAVGQRWGNTRRGYALCLCRAGHSGSAPFPFFPDGSGCAVLNGKQIPIPPSVRLCSHSWAQTPGSRHLLRFAEGFPGALKALGPLQSEPRATGRNQAEPSPAASRSPPRDGTMAAPLQCRIQRNSNLKILCCC